MIDQSLELKNENAVIIKMLLNDIKISGDEYRKNYAKSSLMIAVFVAALAVIFDYADLSVKEQVSHMVDFLSGQSNNTANE